MFTAYSGVTVNYNTFTHQHGEFEELEDARTWFYGSALRELIYEAITCTRRERKSRNAFVCIEDEDGNFPCWAEIDCEVLDDVDGVCFGDGPACVSIFHRNQYESGPVWVEDRGELLEFVVGEHLCGRGGQIRTWEPSENEGDYPVWVDPVTGSKMTTND